MRIREKFNSLGPRRISEREKTLLGMPEGGLPANVRTRVREEARRKGEERERERDRGGAGVGGWRGGDGWEKEFVPQGEGKKKEEGSEEIDWDG